MHGLRSILTLSLAVVAVPATALADSSTAPVRPFVLPDLSGLTMVGGGFQLSRWTDHPLGNAAIDNDHTTLVFDIDGEIALAPHWVILAGLPIVYDSVDSDIPNTDCCELGIGNFTAGVRALASSRFGEARSVIGGTVTVSLPTASDEDERGASAVAATLTELPHDPGRYLPNATTVRLAAAAQFYGDLLFVQPELGLHLFIYDDDVENDDSDVAIRLGVAGGVRATRELAILAELNNMIFLGENERSEDDIVSSVDLGLRYGSDNLLLGLRFYLPIDSDLRDLDMFGIGFDAGVRL